MAHPEHTWMAIFTGVAALIAIGWLIRRIGVKEAADANPLAADSMPSLNLSERDTSRSHAAVQQESMHGLAIGGNRARCA